jgi:hypothetical protein
MAKGKVGGRRRVRLQRRFSNRFIKAQFALFTAPSSGGRFTLGELTEEGRSVLAAARRFAGKAPTYRGANIKGIYLKWLIEPGLTGKLRDEGVRVFGDWLQEAGYTVGLEHQTAKGSGNHYVKINIR